MVDLVDAMIWWDKWQLRVLVLGSLLLQWFILLAAPMRKYAIWPCFRTFIWLAYISSDALAIYALATLFNRHARATGGCGASGGGGQASALEVLWAPILLMHLGGQQELTAYGIEDNELWTRHTVTLVSQVTVAVYAFYKAWPSTSDPRLLALSVLLFITGFFSFCEKPWALYRARINRLAAVSSMLGDENRSKWNFCFTELGKLIGRGSGGKIHQLSERVKVHMILSDLSLYAVATDLGEELEPIDPGAHVSQRLRSAFEIIYTRANVVMTPAYLSYHLLLVPSLHAAAIALFARIPKHGYEGTDVKMTYILMCLTAALDVLAGCIRGLLHLILYCKGVPALCETIPEYNLVTSVLRRKQPCTGGFLKCVTFIRFSEECLIRDPRKEGTLYQLFLGFFQLDLLKTRGGSKGLDLASYRSLSPDNWILPPDLQKLCKPEVRRTLRLESFDKSVLLWHIATDLCWKQMDSSGTEEQKALRRCTLAISNYMAHLLNFRADMLLTGSRRHLFTKAMNELEAILVAGIKDKRLHGSCSDDNDNRALAEEITDAAIKDAGKYPIFNRACVLAKELLELPNDEDRWNLMYRVWVGMLCYSASMCRGYLHAKSLGEGGEFLSIIWLLISLKGAKTLSDKLQMPETEEGDEELRMTPPSPPLEERDEESGKEPLELPPEGSNRA